MSKIDNRHQFVQMRLVGIERVGVSIVISRKRIRSRSTSRIVTSAPSPVAMRAALTPEVPPPTTTTLPGNTPGTPPSKTPLPPLCLARKFAPIMADIRPAISLIGSRNGKTVADLNGLVGDTGHARF